MNKNANATTSVEERCTTTSAHQPIHTRDQYLLENPLVCEIICVVLIKDRYYLHKTLLESEGEIAAVHAVQMRRLANGHSSVRSGNGFNNSKPEISLAQRSLSTHLHPCSTMSLVTPYPCNYDTHTRLISTTGRSNGMKRKGLF